MNKIWPTNVKKDIVESKYKKQTVLNQGGFVYAIESLATAITLLALNHRTPPRPPTKASTGLSTKETKLLSKSKDKDGNGV